MRATKQITCIKHLTYAERLSYLNLPTLHVRKIRGDMIMVFKIVTGIMESTVSCNYISSHSIWNGLPDHVVSACSVRILEKRLDFFWRNHDCSYNWKATITGIGNRSLILCFFQFSQKFNFTMRTRVLPCPLFYVVVVVVIKFINPIQFNSKS